MVIGSTDLTSYFGKWGLSGPAHILVLVAAVAIAVLAAVPNKVPAWLRSGVGGLFLGVFVLGLVWPYVIGPLGASIGSLMDLVGAVVLIVAGVLGDLAIPSRERRTGRLSEQTDERPLLHCAGRSSAARVTAAIEPMRYGGG